MSHRHKLYHTVFEIASKKFESSMETPIVNNHGNKPLVKTINVRKNMLIKLPPPAPKALLMPSAILWQSVRAHSL